VELIEKEIARHADFLSGQVAAERSWTIDPPGREAKSEWWVTALAVDALDKVIEMLNEEINRQVLEQFHVRQPTKLELKLDQLFYPDFGLTSLRMQQPDRSDRQKINVAVKLVELIEKEIARHADFLSEFPVWREQEETFRACSLHASLMALWPHLAVSFSEETLKRLHALGENRTGPAGALTLIVELRTILTNALGDIPEAEEILDRVPPAPAAAAPTPPAIPPVTTATRRANETVSDIVAHGLRAAAEDTARRVLVKFISALKQPTGLAENLRAGARIVRDLLAPIATFAEGTIDRELARPQLGLTVDAAELVFAACLLGHLSNWQHPKVKSAFQLVGPLLSSNGRLLSLRPFNVQSQGYRLNVATIEVTRRLAELAAHAAVEIEPAFVETLMRPFEDTRAPGQVAAERSWTIDPPGREAKSEWWVTALAVDALDKVIEPGFPFSQ
jgi:hypothetical protein